MHSWINQKWLEENPITSETILSYFALSPFYDQSSLNEVLKMQTQFNTFLDLNQKLRDMNGLRYIVEERNEIFYIFKIDKQGTEENTVDFYYVMYGTIFKGTTVNQIYRTRLMNFLFYVNSSFDKFYKERIFDPIEGFKIRSEKKEKDQEKKDEEEKAIHEYVIKEIAKELQN